MCRLFNGVEKYGRAGHATDDDMVVLCTQEN